MTGCSPKSTSSMHVFNKLKTCLPIYGKHTYLLWTETSLYRLSCFATIMKIEPIPTKLTISCFSQTLNTRTVFSQVNGCPIQRTSRNSDINCSSEWAQTGVDYKRKEEQEPKVEDNKDKGSTGGNKWDWKKWTRTNNQLEMMVDSKLYYWCPTMAIYGSGCVLNLKNAASSQLLLPKSS